MGTIILCSVLSVFIAALVVYKPYFVLPETAYFQAEEEGHVFSEQLSMLEVLSELEQDFKSGKLTQKEYDQLALDTKREYLKLKHQQDA